MKIKYASEDKKDIAITIGTSTEVVPSYESMTKYIDIVSEFINMEGGVIELYQTEVEVLQEAKDTKIASIDSQTSADIELLAGDNNKQKALLAEAVMLERAERLGDTTVSTRLDELFTMNMAIEQLKIDGNTKEALVASCTTIAEVEAVI